MKSVKTWLSYLYSSWKKDLIIISINYIQMISWPTWHLVEVVQAWQKHSSGLHDNILVNICHNSQEHYPDSLVCPQENYVVLLFAPIHQKNWPKVKVVKFNSFLNIDHNLSSGPQEVKLLISNIAQSNYTYFHEVLSDHINCPNSNKKLREFWSSWESDYMIKREVRWSWSCFE